MKKSSGCHIFHLTNSWLTKNGTISKICLQICDRLTNERNNVQDVIRQEFADRLVATEEENKRLKNEMSEMRARHKLELSRIKESKDEEMEEVHKR